MKSVRLFIVVSLCLFVVGLGWTRISVGQESKQTDLESKQSGKKVELLPSQMFNVNYANLETLRNRPHLQYRLVNVSGIKISKMVVEMMAYDQDGKVQGGARWVSRVNLKEGDSLHNILAIEPKFASAARLTLEFSPLSLGGDGNFWDGVEDFEDSNCTNDFCGPTGDCGGRVSRCDEVGGLDSYNCQQGSGSNPCKCSFMCKPRPPAQ